MVHTITCILILYACIFSRTCKTAMPALLSDDRTLSLPELEISLSNYSVIWLGGSVSPSLQQPEHSKLRRSKSLGPLVEDRRRQKMIHSADLKRLGAISPLPAMRSPRRCRHLTFVRLHFISFKTIGCLRFWTLKKKNHFHFLKCHFYPFLVLL